MVVVKWFENLRQSELFWFNVEDAMNNVSESQLFVNYQNLIFFADDCKDYNGRVFKFAYVRGS